MRDKGRGARGGTRRADLVIVDEVIEHGHSVAVHVV
jgi:hypothetical protein